MLACDAYHALVSDRPYRAALPAEDALRELECCAGTQFDPGVVDALVSCVTERDTLAENAAPDEDEPMALEPESRLEMELRALITVAAAVAAAHVLDDVIEIAAEEARACARGGLALDQPARGGGDAAPHADQRR